LWRYRFMVGPNASQSRSRELREVGLLFLRVGSRSLWIAPLPPVVGG
jgi:hypothetical protein